jgi:hypothetical protein
MLNAWKYGMRLFHSAHSCANYTQELSPTENLFQKIFLEHSKWAPCDPIRNVTSEAIQGECEAPSRAVLDERLEHPLPSPGFIIPGEIPICYCLNSPLHRIDMMYVFVTSDGIVLNHEGSARSFAASPARWHS